MGNTKETFQKGIANTEAKDAVKAKTSKFQAGQKKSDLRANFLEFGKLDITTINSQNIKSAA